VKEVNGQREKYRNGGKTQIDNSKEMVKDKERVREKE